MGKILPWPTRYPGRPYWWVLSLDDERPSPRCVSHNARTDGLGVCAQCVSEWRASLGANPTQWIDCRICGFPLHPTVEAEGFDTCPSCDEKYSRKVIHA